MNTNRFQGSHNRARFSGSIPMPLSLPWTRVLVHASEATAPKIVNSGTPVVTRCAAQISHGVTSHATHREGRMESHPRFATLLLLTLCRRSHRGRQSFRDLRRGMPSRDCIVPIGVPTISSIVAWLCLRRCHVTPGGPDLFAAGFRCLRKGFHLSNGIPSLLCDDV